jgi:two-component system, NarL family, invasion response regulator UvrY
MTVGKRRSTSPKRPRQIATAGLVRSRAVNQLRARVLAADDSSSFLALLRNVVDATCHLEVVGDADCGERAVELARELQPEMVLIDVRMPGIGGLEAAKRIRATHPSALIVLISTAHPDELPRDAHEGAADAIIWKSELDPELLDDVWLRYPGQSPPATP